MLYEVYPPKAIALLCAPGAFCLSSFAGESRISGVYVGHGANFAEMLQLTQTANGQISGVFTSVELDSVGAISSSQTNVSGSNR
jgi:hypothetical protein